MGVSEYDSAGVPLRHQPFRPANNTCDGWRVAYEHMRASIEKGGIIAVLGPRGTGKTQLGSSVIGYNSLMKDRGSLYCKSFDIFLRIREAMGDRGSSERQAVGFYTGPFLLVIDAYEVRSDSPFENRTLDHIIDLRYDDMKPTIIISNDKPEPFINSVGPSIASRLKETGGIIETKWGSFR